MIDTTLVKQIAECYSNHRNDPAIVSHLRDSFPQVRFTHCNNDELGRAKPVLECAGFNLYLVGGEHCLSVTNGFNGAKGVIIADVDEDE